MTFKNATFPTPLYMVWDDDEEVFDGVLVGIADIDTEADRCVLLVDDLMPQTARLKVPYSLIDASAIHLATGVHIFLDADEVEQWKSEQK